MQKGNKRFVIVAMPRAGTSMLTLALKDIKNVNMHGEIFVASRNHSGSGHPQKVMRDLIDTDEGNNLWSYMSEKHNREDRDLTKLVRVEDISYFLEKRLCNGKYAGFKLLHTHLSRIPLVKDYIKYNDMYVIHLHRENVLKQVISGEIKADPKIDVSKIPGKINKIHKGNKELTKWFKGKRYVKISYEELTNDKNSDTIDIRKISRLLGIRGDSMVKVPLEKYGPSGIKERVTNYNDILNGLKDCKTVRKEWLNEL